MAADKNKNIHVPYRQSAYTKILGRRNKLILCGLGVEDRHARLYEINKKYYIEPLCDQAIEYTLVNGKPVDKKMEIFHNDRIIFGTNSVFLFKNFNQKGIKSPDKKRG